MYGVRFSGLYPTREWSSTERKAAWKVLRAALTGVGDGARWERMFRMDVTMCLHRGLSDEEMERLPTRGCPTSHLAGGPVEVFYSRGIPDGLLSCDPCDNPQGQRLAGPNHKHPNPWDLYVYEDCRFCGPCLQRMQIAEDPAEFISNPGMVGVEGKAFMDRKQSEVVGATAADLAQMEGT